MFKCLFGNPSDADKRSESKINTKQIIFVYRGERSKDRSHTFSKISCLFETTQEEIFILIVWKIFPNIHEVFVDWIYDQTTGFIDIQQTSPYSEQWVRCLGFFYCFLPKFQFPNDKLHTIIHMLIKIQFSRWRRRLILAFRKCLVWKTFSALICQWDSKLKNCSAVSINN